VVTVAPETDAGIPVGGATAFAFTGSYTGENLLPTLFMLNGVQCRLLLATAPRSDAGPGERAVPPAAPAAADGGDGGDGGDGTEAATPSRSAVHKVKTPKPKHEKD
jgi:hypothetical protein